MSFIETSSAPNGSIRPHFILRVLGSPAELLVGGTPHTFTNSKHLAILAYLTLEPGEYGREQLTRFVWSSGAAGSIDNAISELRGAFGPDVIPHRARKIALDPRLVDVDALRLLSAADDPGARAQAIESYGGEFLEGFKTRGSAESFVRWIERTRGRLETTFRLLCEQECQAAATGGDWERVRTVADLGARKSRGWTGWEEWREAAEGALRTKRGETRTNGATHHMDRAIAEPELSAVSSGCEPAVERPPRRRSVRSLPALAVLSVVLLVTVTTLVLRGRFGGPEPLVQMPPIRADELPAPGSPLRRLSDWLRTDGRWIYYRYERYMPGACRHSTIAAGNFGKDSWKSGPPVACLNAAWLAVDGEQLIDRYSLVCVL